MCNMPFDDDKKKIETILDACQEEDRLKFWACFRRAQYHLLKAEELYVNAMRANMQRFPDTYDTRRFIAANNRDLDQQISLCHSFIPLAIEHFDEANIARLKHVALVELKIIESVSYQWMHRLAARQAVPGCVNLSAARTACDNTISELLKLPDGLLTHNNVEIGVYNNHLWVLRLLYHHYSTTKNREMAEEIKTAADLAYDTLVAACKRNIEERTAPNTAYRNDYSDRVSDSADREVRIRLNCLIPTVVTDPDPALFGSYLRECGIFELKVLDTVIGYRLVRQGFDVYTDPKKHDAPAYQFNVLLQERLVKIAAKGDYSFHTFFAFTLLQGNRLHDYF